MKIFKYLLIIFLIILGILFLSMCVPTILWSMQGV